MVSRRPSTTGTTRRPECSLRRLVGYVGRVRVGGVLAVCVGLFGCSNPALNVEKLSYRDSVIRTESSIFDSDQLSEATRTMLFSLGLEQLPPDEVVLGLERVIRRTSDPRIHLAHSEYLSYVATLRPTVTEFYLLESALAAYQALISLSRDPHHFEPERFRALRYYNIALRRWLALRLEHDPSLSEHSAAGVGRSYSLSPVLVGESESTRHQQYLIAAEYGFEGIASRQRRPGIGVDLIGMTEPRGGEEWPSYFPREGVFRPVTAILEPSVNHPGPASSETPATIATLKLSLVDPTTVERWWVGALTTPTSADFTAPIACLTSRSRHPAPGTSVSSGYAGILLLEDYDPAKVPLVLVHGLWSTPAAWLALVSEIHGDPDLRSRFQIWHYRYPTGAPIVENAARLRESLIDIREQLAREHTYPRNMVLVGHGMGGVLARTVVQSSGDRLLESAFSCPIAELELDAEETATLRRSLVFEPLPFVDRVIFLGTPHRGTTETRAWLDQLAIQLIQAPSPLRSLLARLRDRYPFDVNYDLSTDREELDPGHPLNRHLVELPIRTALPYHTIMGRWGARAGDGIVPHGSSRLPGSFSELIVPSSHALFRSSAAIHEIKLILRHHIAQTFPAGAQR